MTSLLAISCGRLTKGINTVEPKRRLSYPETYNYTCITGYVTNDTTTIQCLVNGSLSLANPPTCTSK